jgi:predicted MFS family arabinose efflux permease
VAFGNFSMMVSMGTLLGPLFGGFSIDHVGFLPAFGLISGLGLIGPLLLSVWGGVLPGGTSRGAPALRIRETLADPEVWRILATTSLVQVSLDVFLFYMPVYGHSLAFSAFTIGLVLALFSGACFVARFAMPRILSKLTLQALLAWSFALSGVTYVAMPFFRTALPLEVLAFLYGLAFGCLQPITIMLTFSWSAQGRSGEALGLRLTANHLMRMIGPVVFGSIASAFGLSTIFWVIAALLGGGAALSRPRASRT